MLCGCSEAHVGDQKDSLHSEKNHLKHYLFLPFILTICLAFGGAQCARKSQVTLELFPNPCKPRVNDSLVFSLRPKEGLPRVAASAISNS